MSRSIAYVSCAREGLVVSFRLDDAIGVLTETVRTAVPGPFDPPATSMPLALSPDHRRLYAACRNPPFPVSAFDLDGNGAMTLAGSGHLADAMAYIATDRTGRWLFGASYGGAKLSVNAIDAAGVPGEPLQVLATPPKAHSILPDPENRAVYAAVLGGDAILRQPFDATTGRLAEPALMAAHTAAGAGPRHFRFARGGARLYCLNEIDATLNAYARDAATGALTELQSVRVVPPAADGASLAAADLQLTPDERFLYASVRSTNTLTGFRLRADGTLETLATVAAEPAPRGFAIDPHGRWLLCAGQDSGCVAVYGIEARSGTLTRLAAYPAGGNASWIEIVEWSGEARRGE